jgi:hypothetical protein
MIMDHMTLVFFCVPFFEFCVENHGTDVGVLVFSIGTKLGRSANWSANLKTQHFFELKMAVGLTILLKTVR